MTDKSVLCVGYTNWDVVIHTDTIPDPDHSSTIAGDHASSGGSAANTALSLASRNINTTILGTVGNDTHGEYVTDALLDGNVEPALKVTDEATTVVYAIITDNADPRYIAKNEALGEFGIEDLENDAWDDFDHIHVTSFDKTIAGEIAQQAKADGKTVSFNPSQGYSRETFDDVVDAADVIFLNEREANLFRDRHNFGEIAAEKCIVITQGSAGSTAYTPDGVFHQMGGNVADIEDTIGAGDAFVAGFIDGWLETNDIELALTHGNACGAYAVTQIGAPDSLDLDWIDTHLS